MVSKEGIPPSFHPFFKGRQHAIRPDRWFHPRPAAAGFSDLLSPIGHSRWFPFHRSTHLASTFLHPFAPRALPRFLTTMGALTPAQAALRPVSIGNELRPPSRTGLPALRARPSEHSIPNHLARPRRRFTTQPLSATGFYGSLFTIVRASPIPSRLAIRPGRIGFVSCGLLIHLLLLSTPPHGGAVTFSFRPECAYLERTCTSLTMHAHRRTRGGFQTRPYQ